MQPFIVPSPRVAQRTLHRLFDMLVALLLALMMFPLLLGIACAIRLGSPGPVLFRQLRVGHRGRLFTIYKFRSLRTGPHHPHRPYAHTTPIGAFLRRYGLDELPQLYNILKGDMTFIGPRPILPAEVQGYDIRQRQRLLVHPGLTGWAQVNGRNALAWSERVALDVWYVEHRSLRLDLVIVWRTLPTLLKGTGVYGPGNCDPGNPALNRTARSWYRPTYPPRRACVRRAALTLTDTTSMHRIAKKLGMVIRVIVNVAVVPSEGRPCQCPPSTHLARMRRFYSPAIRTPGEQRCTGEHHPFYSPLHRNSMKTLPLAYRRKCFFLALVMTLMGLLSGPVHAQFPLPVTGPLDLLPPAQATHVVQNSGDWTDATTWVGGAVPNHLAKVLIPPGKTLVVDAEIATRIKIIRIQGKLAFSTTANTALLVETIVQEMGGALEMGTAEHPIPAGTTATITIIDEGDIELNTDQWEKGLLLMGQTVAYGAQKDSWVTVAVNPIMGATTLDLQTAPVGWVPGDRIVITGTDPIDATSDEVATIQAISGTSITLDQPLTKNHTSPAPDLFVHVANLSRNIVIESESPTSNNGLDRGHVMFMHTLDVDFNYVRLHKMGRTRKDVPVDDWVFGEDDVFVNGPRTNVRGRYSMHFHRGGASPTLTPAHVKGCVIEDDPGWAYVNHSAYVHFDDNVSYNVIGGGFQTEAGDELGSFTNNIAIRTVNLDYPIRLEFPDNAPDTREESQDFAFQGDGFWIHGGGVSVSGNVASGSSGHAFIYWPEGLIEPGFPTETLRNTFKPENLGLPNSINIVEGEDALATGWVPIAGFSNNEAYSAGIGLATYYLHTTFFADIGDYDPAYIATVHSTFEDFTAWNIDQQGVQLNFTERVTFKNFRLVNNDGDPTSQDIWTSHYRSKEQQIFENTQIEGFGTGFALPPQGRVTIDGGYLKNGVNMYIPSPMLSYRDMRIEGLATEPDPAFSNPRDIQMEALFSPPDDKFTAFFLLPDKIILNYGPYSNQRLYFNEQAADYKPLPVDGEPYTIFDEERYILPEFAGKTNQDLQNEYRMSFGGSLLPADAVDAVGIAGGKIREWQNETLNVPVCVDVLSETEVDEINACITNAGSNKVAGPLPPYDHPISVSTTHTHTHDEYGLEKPIIPYPHPTAGIVFIPVEPAEYRVDVFALHGALVHSFSQSGKLLEVDLSNFSDGMYFIRIENMQTGHLQTGKAIKTK